MKMFKCFALALTVSLLAGAAYSGDTPTSALYWMVNNDSITSIYGSEWASVADASAYVNAARVAATKDGSTVYLNLYDPNQTSAGTVVDVIDGYTIGSDAGTEAGLWADVSDYSGYTFAIELGNYDATGDKWEKFAWGESASYAALSEANYISFQGASDPADPWTGTFGSGFADGGYAVPEPTSGMLLLMGGALLALRRRRNVKVA